MICPVCDEVILDDKFMFSLEKPYMNVYLHKNCYLKIRDNLLAYLTVPENIDKFMKTYENYGKLR